MVSATASGLLSLALLCWPAGPGPSRARALLVRAAARHGDRTRWRAGRYAARVVPLVVVVSGALVAGWAGSLASGAVVALGSRGWRAARARRDRAASRTELVDAVGQLVVELRAGGHPAAAAAAVAGSGEHAVHRALGTVALGASWGARVPVLLRREAVATPALSDGLTRLASAWELSERHGIALADLLDAVRADLESRSRMADELRAQLAGPRATVAVLAALPALGVLLGEGMGAEPLRVLTATGVGQLLLIAGTVLSCGGVLWSDRIMSAGEPR